MGKVIDLAQVTYIINGRRELITERSLKRLKVKMALTGKLIGGYA